MKGERDAAEAKAQRYQRELKASDGGEEVDAERLAAFLASYDAFLSRRVEKKSVAVEAERFYEELAGLSDEQLVQVNKDFVAVYLSDTLPAEVVQRLQLEARCEPKAAAEPDGPPSFVPSDLVRQHAESVCGKIANDYLDDLGNARQSRAERVAAVNRQREQRAARERQREKQRELDRIAYEAAAALKARVQGIADEAEPLLAKLRPLLLQRGLAESDAAAASGVPKGVLTRFERKAELTLLCCSVDELRSWPLNRWRALSTSGLTYSEMCCLVVHLQRPGIPGAACQGETPSSKGSRRRSTACNRRKRRRCSRRPWPRPALMRRGPRRRAGQAAAPTHRRRRWRRHRSLVRPVRRRRRSRRRRRKRLRHRPHRRRRVVMQARRTRIPLC